MDEGLTVEVDPLASMRCWEIELELGGRVYEIPALSALDWWPVLTSGDLDQVLDFVVSRPDDPANLDDLLLSGNFSLKELKQARIDAIEAAAGRSLHCAIVLVSVMNTHWATLNGALVRRGFRWEGQPLGAVLDAVYSELINRLDEKANAEFHDILENESLTTDKSRKAGQRAVNEFESMAGPKPTTGAVATGAPSDSGRPKTQPRPRQPRQSGPSRVPRTRPGPPA